MRVFSGVSGTELFAVTGDEAYDNVGYRTQFGDLDGDGVTDLLVASPDDNVGGVSSSGSVRAISGVDGTELWSVAGGTNERLGDYVISLIDLEGDGASEVIVHSPFADPGGVANAGRIAVLSGVDGSERFAFEGDETNGRVGQYYARTADVNGDGTTDLVMANLYDDVGGLGNAGSVRVLSGVDGAGLLLVEGDDAYDQIGNGSIQLVDLNEDGATDVLIGSQYDDVNGVADAGSLRAFSGADGSALFTVAGDDQSDRIAGYDQRVPLTDFDGDGTLDLVLRARYDDVNGVTDASSVRVLSGADGTELWRIEGDAYQDWLGGNGIEVADVNGDGTPDLVIRSQSDDVNGLTDAGSIRVHSGADGTELLAFYGDRDYHRFGNTSVQLEDVNGDGATDLIIADTNATVNGLVQAGRVRVVSGIDGTDIVSLEGGEAYDRVGTVRLADLDGDGTAEIIVIAREDDPDGVTDAGSVRVFSGADGTERFMLAGDDVSDGFGRIVMLADMDRDGTDDLVVQSSNDTVDETLRAGSVRVFSGVDGEEMFAVAGDDPSDHFGEGGVQLADLNGDGTPDLVVSSRYDDVDGVVNVGSVRVFSGADGTLMHTETGMGAHAQLGNYGFSLIDANGDGALELLVGSGRDDVDGEADAGSVRLVSFAPAAWTGGTAIHQEGGDVTPIAPDAVPTDPELDAAADGAGDYGGATLTFAIRDAAATDELVGTGTLSLAAGTATLNGVAVGTYTLADGALAITFAAGTTSAQAAGVATQVGYRTTTDAPASGVTVDVTLSDGDAGSADATHAVAVAIEAVNDAPTLAGEMDGVTVDDDLPLDLAVPVGLFADPDGKVPVVSAALADGSPLPVWLAFDGARFTGTPPGEMSLRIALTATDAGGLAAAETFTLTVAEITDTILGTPGDDALTGFADDNTLIGGMGDDVIAGGAGEDAAVYAGAFGDYDVRIADDGASVRVTAAAGALGEGTDTVMADVEALAFGDGARVAAETSGSVVTGWRAVDAGGETLAAQSALTGGGTFTAHVEDGRVVRKVRTDDEANSKTWDTVVTTLDAAGEVASLTWDFDDGSRRIDTLDAGVVTGREWLDETDALPWASIADTFDDGVRTGRRRVDDDGDVTSVAWTPDGSATTELDVSDAQPWTTRTSHRDAVGVAVLRRTVEDDGDVNEIVFEGRPDRRYDGLRRVRQQGLARLDGDVRRERRQGRHRADLGPRLRVCHGPTRARAAPTVPRSPAARWA